MAAFSKEKKFLSHLIRLELKVFKGEFSPDALFKGTNLTESSFLDPYLKISEHQDVLFHKNLLSCIDTRLAGIRVGQSLNLYDMGPLGQLLASSSSSNQTNGFESLSKDLFYQQVEWRRDTDDQFVYWIAKSDRSDEVLYRFHIERCFSIFRKVMSLLFPGLDQPAQVCFDFGESDERQELERFFGCEVLFDQGKSLISYDLINGGRKAVSFDPKVNQALLSLVESLVCELQCQSQVESEVRQYLMECQGEFPKLNGIATKLCVSERTLSRRLQEEGVSYQIILDEVRKLKAASYLRQGGLTVLRVSELCGFKDEKSFVRSFKRWTGKTPSMFKDSDD